MLKLIIVPSDYYHRLEYLVMCVTIDEDIIKVAKIKYYN